jgi:hypothetical protein
MPAYGSRQYGVGDATSLAYPPTTISGLMLWFEAGQISGVADGGAVATWSDASGNGHDATQATGTKQPLYRSTGTLPNGKPVVVFDGVDDTLGLSATLGSAATVFMVCNPSAVASAYLIGGNGSGNTPAIISGFSSKSFEYFDSGDRQTLSASGTGFHVLSVVQTDGSSYAGWFDGASAFSASPTVNISGKTLTTIGSAGGTSNFAGFSVAEIIVYNRALTTTERQQVESYLTAKYISSSSSSSATSTGSLSLSATAALGQPATATASLSLSLAGRVVAIISAYARGVRAGRTGHATPAAVPPSDSTTLDFTVLASAGTDVAGATPPAPTPAPAGRWQLEDPVAEDIYVFATNPKTADSPLPERKVTDYPTTTGQRFISFEGARPATRWTLTGTTLDEAEYTALKDFAKKQNKVYLSDDLGRTFIAYLEDFAHVPRKSVDFWVADYTLKVLVFGGAL